MHWGVLNSGRWLCFQFWQDQSRDCRFSHSSSSIKTVFCAWTFSNENTVLRYGLSHFHKSTWWVGATPGRLLERTHQRIRWWRPHYDLCFWWTEKLCLPDKNGKTTCKVRGFTLNYRGSQKLNFSTMCEQVCRPNGEPIFLENPHFIKRDAKTKTIHTVALKKKYKLVYDKRVVCGFDTFPYGYR